MQEKDKSQDETKKSAPPPRARKTSAKAAMERARRKTSRHEPSAKEANLTFLAVLIGTSLALFLVKAVFSWQYSLHIALAVLGFITSILFFACGAAIAKKSFYYVSLALGALSVGFSLAATLTVLSVTVTMLSASLITIGLISAALVNFVTNLFKRTELIFSTVFTVGAVVWTIVGIALWNTHMPELGIPFVFLGTAASFLFGAFTLYLVQNEGFFKILCLNYFIIIIVALVIAIVAISGGDGCDCGGDCGCGGTDGDGRRKKKSK